MTKKFLLFIAVILIGFKLFAPTVAIENLIVEDTFAECSDEDKELGIPCSDTGFNSPSPEEVPDKINEPSFRVQVMKLVNYFLTFLGLLAVVALIYAGILMVADFGSEENAGKAKNIIMWAGAGLIIVLISYAFVNWILDSGDYVSDGATQEEQVEEVGNSENNGGGNTIDNGIEKYINEIISNIGKLDAQTAAIIDRINKNELLNQRDFELALDKLSQKQSDYLKMLLTSDKLLEDKDIEEIRNALKGIFGDTELEELISFLKTGYKLQEEDLQIIEDSLEAQGYSPNISNTIKDKIIKGKALTQDESNMVKTALKYGLMIERLETELSILNQAMPQTALNVATYNSVLTTLVELKEDPSNEKRIKSFEGAFEELKRVIANTPRMIAKIKAGPNFGEAPLLVTFDGTDSLDPNNQTIPSSSYYWTYYDLKGAEKTIGKGPIIDYMFEEPGAYIVYLRTETNMKDNGYKTAMDGIDKVKIKVQPPSSNLRLYINGEEVQAIKKIHISEAKKGISFDASKSIPQMGRKIVEYSWLFGDGTNDYSENGEAIVHRYDKVGTYNVKLDVKDNTGTTSSKTLKIVVEHLTTEITANPKTGTTQTNFNFDSDKSKSSDNLVQSFFWEIKDESGTVLRSSEEKDIEFKAEKSGQYSVQLTTSDTEGNESSDIYTLKVSSLPPNANYTFQKKSQSLPSTIIFNAVSSNDPENELLTYSWDFDGDNIFDIQETQESMLEYTYTKTGAYKPLLKVSDPSGESDIFQRSIIIDSILDIDFEINPVAVQKNKEILFTPLSIYGKSFYWDFGDGTRYSSSDKKITHSYTKAGTYDISLTTFDKDDNENSIQKRVFIGDEEHPVASFEIEIDGRKYYPKKDVCKEEALGIIVSRRDNIKFIGTSSINIDGSSHMLDYVWDFGDGAFGNSKVSAHKYTEILPNNECFNVKLTVKDRVTGKHSETQDLFIKVENLLPQLQNLIVDNNESSSKEKITPYSVNLQAQGAQDLDGSIKKYRWWYRKKNETEDEKRGIIQTQNSFANLTILSDGFAGEKNEYVFVVEMTDNDGNIVTNEESIGESISLEIKNGNVEAPEINFTTDKNQIYAGDTISFFAQIENLSQEEGLIYEWDFNGDGIFDDTISGKQVTRKFDTPGEYNVRLRVKYKGLTSSKIEKVYVDSVTRYPLAAFTYQVKELEFFADASTSRYDPALEDHSLRYYWDFDKYTDSNGDGEADNDVDSMLLSSHYTYEKPGEYNVILTVIDSIGNKDEVDQKIKIATKNNTNLSSEEISLEGKHSIFITSKNSSLTSLDLILNKKIIKEGDSVILKAKVTNADSSPYEKTVEFEIIKGYGFLEKDTIKAQNGVAETVLHVTKTGEIIIKVIARETFHETLEEQIVLNIEQSEQDALTTVELTEEEKKVRLNLEKEAENTLIQLNKN